MNKNIIIIAIIILILLAIGIGFWFFSKPAVSPSAPIIPVGVKEESKINGDATAAINQELNSADLGDLDAEFNDIDAELKNL